MTTCKTSKMNETKTMNCGMDATIIKQCANNYVNLRFADGTVRKHVQYSNFAACKVAHPNRIRIGRPKMMKCGHTATVIGGRNPKDVDVMFEDGTVRTGVSMASFYQGTIPYMTRTEKHARERLFEKKRMNSGEYAFIAAYNSSTNVDVCFAGGYMKTGVTYASFANRTLSARGAVRTEYSKTSTLEPRETVSDDFCASNMRFISYGSAKETTEQQPVSVDLHFHPGGHNLPPISVNEFAISYYLREVAFEKSKKGKLKSVGLGQFELDLYNKDLKVAIEYDGFLHGVKGALERDLRKNQCCKNAGIDIIRIRESNLDDIDDGISYNIKLTSKPNTSLPRDLEDAIRVILKRCGLPMIDINFERDEERILASYKETLEMLNA